MNLTTKFLLEHGNIGPAESHALVDITETRRNDADADRLDFRSHRE